MRSLASLILFLAACGTDVVADPTCETSYLTYENFGAPFMTNWCRGCHSVQTIPSQRQFAPVDVNFDTLDDIRNQMGPIMTTTTSAAPTMPPVGGPSDLDRAALREWLECGAR